MWSRIRSIANATKRVAKTLAAYTRNSIAAIPRSLHKIKTNENVASAFKNMLSANVFHFLIPWTVLNYGKRFLFDFVSYEFGIPKTVTSVAETLVDYSIMSIMLLRWRLQLIALNTATTITGASEIDTAFTTSAPTTNPLCTQCSAQSKFLDNIASQLHFLLLNIGVWGSRALLGDTIGPLTAFLLRCYTDGFIAYQYGQPNLCGAHQVEVLTSERARCFTLGLTTQLLLQLPVKALALAGIPLSNETQLVWSNLLTLFGILHARTLEPPQKISHADDYALFDPVVLTWGASRTTIRSIAELTKFLIRYEKDHPHSIAPYMKALRDKLGKASSHSTINLLTHMMVPAELRSFKALAENPHVSPYSQLAIAKLEYYLQRTKDITGLIALKTARSLVRNRWLGQPASKIGKWYLQSFHDWPEDVIDLLIIICKIPHLTQHLEATLAYLRAINPYPYTTITGEFPDENKLLLQPPPIATAALIRGKISLFNQPTSAAGPADANASSVTTTPIKNDDENDEDVFFDAQENPWPMDDVLATAEKGENEKFSDAPEPLDHASVAALMSKIDRDFFGNTREPAVPEPTPPQTAGVLLDFNIDENYILPPPTPQQLVRQRGLRRR